MIFVDRDAPRLAVQSFALLLDDNVSQFDVDSNSFLKRYHVTISHGCTEISADQATNAVFADIFFMTPSLHLSFLYKLNQDQHNLWHDFWQNALYSHPRQHPLFGEIERQNNRTPIYIIADVNSDIKCLAILSMPSYTGHASLFFHAECRRGPVFSDISYVRPFLLQLIRWIKNEKY